MSDCTHPMDAIVAPVATVGMFRIGGMPHCGLCGCPVALAVDGKGQLFIGDTGNYTVRRVDVAHHRDQLLADHGRGVEADQRGRIE